MFAFYAIDRKSEILHQKYYTRSMRTYVVKNAERSCIVRLLIPLKYKNELLSIGHREIVDKQV